MDVAVVSPAESAVSPRTISKPRCSSDPPLPPPTLAPSPNFRETLRCSSKDDHAVPSTPRPARGLSLQMPTSDMPSPALLRLAPLSPRLDSHNIYSVVQSQSQAASPATSLPRHSRGLDFSRACTTLHHSTLAEQRSPDLSPVITQKGMNIPSRKMSVSSMALDSPYIGPGSAWGSLAHERSAVSSSVGSVNMLMSDSESNSSDDDDDASMVGDEIEDPIFATPQVHKLQNPSSNTPFTGPHFTSWNGGNAHSPAAASLLRTIRKSRLNKGGRRNNKSSSSASNSGYSSLASPRTTSPPPMRSIENSSTPGYSGWPKSRRESLALGTDNLHLSSGNDSGDEGSNTAPSTPGVVRRPVTRRGNLLPKTKGFARIRAALAEEASPVDTESRREAETIRQVRERDGSVGELDLADNRPLTATAPSSPALLPAVSESAQEDFGRELDVDTTPSGKGLGGLGVNFSLHANRNSSGMGFWNRFDPSLRTPPPPILPPSFGRQGSSMNSDINMDSPSQMTTGSEMFHRMRGRAHSTASDASEAVNPNGLPNTSAASAGMNDDMHLKKFKRRREDDFDISTIKRRAVSPGMSTQNSPVLTQSPFQREGTWSMAPPERKREKEIGSASSDVSLPSFQNATIVRSGSNGSSGTPVTAGTLAGQGKKLGLQGMVDTNDGLMKMSIE